MKIKHGTCGNCGGMVTTRRRLFGIAHPASCDQCRALPASSGLHGPVIAMVQTSAPTKEELEASVYETTLSEATRSVPRY